MAISGSSRRWWSIEESLLSGPGAAMAKRSFRLMDPVSHRMLAVRADMTLAGRPHRRNQALTPGPALAPLLCRSGLAGEGLQPPARAPGGPGRGRADRFGFGPADAEAILLAAEALNASACAISPSISMCPCSSPRWRKAAAWTTMPRPILSPPSTGAMRRPSAGWPGARRRSFAPCCRRRDRQGLLLPLCQASICRQPPRWSATDWPRSWHSWLASAPKLVLTIDPVEHRGLEYHSGVGFTLLSRGVSGELGRGGRYVSAKGEASTGFTLYLDTLLRAVPPAKPRPALYPAGRNPAPDCRCLACQGMDYHRRVRLRAKMIAPRRGGWAARICCGLAARWR